MKTVTIGELADIPGQPAVIDPDKLVEGRALVQANSGGGKSNLLRLLAEQLGGRLQIIIIDREGEFSTLRPTMDLLIVGPGGELAPAAAKAGELAMRLREHRASTA